MFKNNLSKFWFKKKIKNLHKIYFGYIFRNFAVSFFLWFFVFFILLFAIKRMDGDDSYNFNQNMLLAISRAFNVLLDNIGIISLLSCIFFFVKTEKNFNFNILKSFGLPSKKILMPIILFLTLFNMTNILVLRPLDVKLTNYRKITLMRKMKNDDILLQRGANFMITDEKKHNEYTLIFGTYDKEDRHSLQFSNAVLLFYNNNQLVKNYSAKNAILQNGMFLLKNANYVNITENNDTINNYILKNVKIPTDLSIKDVKYQISNSNKIKNSIKLGFYDYLKTFTKKLSIKNDVELSAEMYFLNEIISFFTTILCCFLSFLFFIFKSRGASIIKISVKCFIVYFIVLRIFKFLQVFMKFSIYSNFFVISIAYMFCAFTCFLIINKDWCNYFTLKITRRLNVLKRKINQKIKDFYEKKLVTLTR